MTDSLPDSYHERRALIPADAVVWRRRVCAGTVSVLPDGCMDLVWLDGRLVVAGPDTRAQLGTAREHSTVYGIRFAPGTAPALLGVPAYELLDRRAELSEVWSSRRARAMTDLVSAAPDPLRGLEDVARRCAEATVPPDPVLALIVRRLDAGDSVAATADALGLGARRLHRLSVAAFGYGPKLLARVLRMRRALELARSDIGLADTAVLAGYADQAHMSRDIRALTGRSPGGVIGGRAPTGAEDQLSGA
ncbi:helix-turn-helix transcriptional regulator [Nocardia spumae]|uniref:helix-turn-helix transcriptional regulator n=1 Tax=Nocardia spumae TaxID=2887190 RepID=UPI001D147A28|nr:helix-turn-helix transcriptional regulator [Nocardia spumae]